MRLATIIPRVGVRYVLVRIVANEAHSTKLGFKLMQQALMEYNHYSDVWRILGY